MAIATVELGRTSVPVRRTVMIRRRRALARRRMLAVLALVAVAVTLLAVAWASRSEAAVQPVTEAVVVAPGDTLWDIAVAAAGEGESVHVLVSEIAQLNDVDPGALRPGSVLQVPHRR